MARSLPRSPSIAFGSFLIYVTQDGTAKSTILPSTPYRCRYPLGLRFSKMLVSTVGILVGWLVSIAVASPVCPLDGPVFPKPQQPSQHEAVKSAVATLKDTFLNITEGAQNYSISIQVFSAHEAEPLFALSHTAPKLATQNTTGVKTVDENTVFRLGSLTKIYTIYSFLINAGDKLWNEPITKYVPELQALANRSDPVDYVAWDDITLGGLASQLTGIPRECQYQH